MQSNKGALFAHYILIKQSILLEYRKKYVLCIHVSWLLPLTLSIALKPLKY